MGKETISPVAQPSQGYRPLLQAGDDRSCPPRPAQARQARIFIVGDFTISDMARGRRMSDGMSRGSEEFAEAAPCHAVRIGIL